MLGQPDRTPKKRDYVTKLVPNSQNYSPFQGERLRGGSDFEIRSMNGDTSGNPRSQLQLDLIETQSHHIE